VLHIDEAQGVYYCHRGSHGGDKFKLVEEVLGCSRRDALVHVAELAGVDFGLSDEEWQAQREKQQKQREILAWASRMLAALRDLETAYRFGGGTDLQRKRLERWIRGIESLSGVELLAWYEGRHLISDISTPAEMALIGEQHKQRQQRMAQAREDATAQMKLLAVEASPEEWAQALKVHLGQKSSKKQSQRDQDRVRDERGVEQDNGEPATRDVDRRAVSA
jgi:hypothetical protein